MCGVTGRDRYSWRVLFSADDVLSAGHNRHGIFKVNSNRRMQPILLRRSIYLVTRYNLLFSYVDRVRADRDTTAKVV